MASTKLHPVHATHPLCSMAAEAQRKLEESRKQTAQLQQQRHSLLQERKAAEEEVATMKLQLREAREQRGVVLGAGLQPRERGAGGLEPVGRRVVRGVGCGHGRCPTARRSARRWRARCSRVRSTSTVTPAMAAASS